MRSTISIDNTEYTLINYFVADNYLDSWAMYAPAKNKAGEKVLLRVVQAADDRAEIDAGNAELDYIDYYVVEISTLSETEVIKYTSKLSG